MYFYSNGRKEVIWLPRGICCQCQLPQELERQPLPARERELLVGIVPDELLMGPLVVVPHVAYGSPCAGSGTTPQTVFQETI